MSEIYTTVNVVDDHNIITTNSISLLEDNVNNLNNTINIEVDKLNNKINDEIILCRDILSNTILKTKIINFRYIINMINIISFIFLFVYVLSLSIPFYLAINGLEWKFVLIILSITYLFINIISRIFCKLLYKNMMIELDSNLYFTKLNDSVKSEILEFIKDTNLKRTFNIYFY